MYTENTTYYRDDRRYEAALEFAVALIKQGTVSRSGVASKAVEIADDLVTQIDERERRAAELERAKEAEAK